MTRTPVRVALILVLSLIAASAAPSEKSRLDELRELGWQPRDLPFGGYSVTVRFDEAKLGSVLEAVEKAAGVTFAVESGTDLSTPVTIAEPSITVGDFLTDILAPNGLTWIENGDDILIRPSYPPPDAAIAPAIGPTVFEREKSWSHVLCEPGGAPIGFLLEDLGERYGFGVAAELGVDLDQELFRFSVGTLRWDICLTWATSFVGLDWDRQGNFIVVREDE